MSQNSPPISSHQVSRGHLVVLLVILLVGSFLRFYQIARPSLWMDEIWSIEISTGRGSAHDQLATGVVHEDQPDLTSLSGASPWWKIFSTMALVTHPPLYHVILRWWMDLWGNGALAVRSLSAVASVLAVAVFFDICRWLRDARVGLFSAGIMALAGAQIDYAQEARSYALVILLGLCAADALIRIEKLGANRSRLISLAAASLALVLTHYLAVAAPLALFVYAIIRLRGRTRTLTILSLVAAGIIAAGIWAAPLIHQMHALPSLTPSFLREGDMDLHIALTYRRLVGLPVEFLVGENYGEKMHSSLVLSIAIQCIVLMILGCFRRWDGLLWVIWLVVVAGFPTVLDLARGTTMVGYLRYTMLASPALYALIAGLTLPWKSLVRYLVPLAGVIFTLIYAYQRTQDGPETKEDWRELASVIQAGSSPGELVVFYNRDPWVSPGMFYMGCRYYSPGFNNPWVLLNEPAHIKTLREIQDRRTLLLVGLFPEMEGKAYLRGWAVASDPEITSAGKVCVMRLVIAPPPAKE